MNMKDKKAAAALIIIIVTSLSTLFTLYFYVSLFFFFGFFNPILILGTAPILLLIPCMQKGKKRYILCGWAVFVAINLLPFLYVGVMEVKNIPEKNARNLEILQLREEISNYETYADLTPFGLGIYKLRHEGDKHLWDVTKPSEHVITFDGVDMVFEAHYNRRENESWDDTWGNSNRGKDVMYDVYFYEGTYLIVTPLWEKPGSLYYWGHIYLCKDIDKNADLFDIGILDSEVVEKLRELPRETLSRKELSEKLGKAM